MVAHARGSEIMKDWIPEEWLKEIEPFGLEGSANEATGTIWNLFLQQERLRDAVKLLDKAGYFLEDISGLDGKEGIEVVYHFIKYDNPCRVTLRIIAIHEAPIVPTISDIFQGANWHERECFDFFGVTFKGHPNLIPLLLPDSFEFHPLVKDAKKRASLFESLSQCQTIGMKVPCAANPDNSGDKE
jgi:NADH-quinone oxidoreductase subunit C